MTGYCDKITNLSQMLRQTQDFFRKASIILYTLQLMLHMKCQLSFFLFSRKKKRSEMLMLGDSVKKYSLEKNMSIIPSAIFLLRRNTKTEEQKC